MHLGKIVVLVFGAFNTLQILLLDQSLDVFLWWTDAGWANEAQATEGRTHLDSRDLGLEACRELRNSLLDEIIVLHALAGLHDANQVCLHARAWFKCWKQLGSISSYLDDIGSVGLDTLLHLLGLLLLLLFQGHIDVHFELLGVVSEIELVPPILLRRNHLKSAN